MAEHCGTKLRILKTASRLFQKQGYHATGLSQIIRESKAPKGSLYYYFPEGKEQLAIEAIYYTRDTIGKKIHNYLSKIDDPILAIQSLVRATAREVQDSKRIAPCTISLLTLETSLVSEPLRKACSDTNMRWKEIFIEKLRSGGYSMERSQELGTLVQVMIDGGLISSMAQKDTRTLLYIANQIPLFLKREDDPE